MTDELKTQVAVIGAGPGGYPAAFAAADLGLEVTLIDVEPNPGGVCLYRGCIPSKALLSAAALIEEASHASDRGITFGAPAIDLDKLRAWKDSVIAKMTGGLGELSKKRNVRFLQGRARLQHALGLTVTPASGPDTRVSFDHCIIATGSRPAFIPSLDIESPRVMNSTGALALADVPKTLLVIGGGYIGLELGTVYSSLGSQVSVVEMAPSLLPGADADLVAVLQRRLEKRFRTILTSTTVAGLKEVANGIEVTFTGANVKEPKQVFEKVLVSVGRKPNSSGLGLDTTKAVIDKRGFIEVDLQRRTAEPNIFAIGDVAGDPMLAHKATREGRVAAEAIAGRKVAFEPQAIPAVIFTEPEIAWCGLTENDARKAGRTVKTARFPWAASGRATAIGASDGVTKIVADPESGRVLGVGICGPHAGEMIGEATLAVEMGATVEDLALTIHAHPTLSETLMEAAEVFHNRCVHLYRPRR